MHALRNGVPKVLAKMTRPNYMELVASTGIESIISPKDIVAAQITSYVRALGNAEGSKVETLYKLLGGEVEALSFTATATAQAMLGKPLKDLKLRNSVLLAAIVRHGEIIIPGGMTTIEEGDQVIVVSRSIGLDDLTDILA
jgi:trk system potassium uptake protein TrkA